MFFRKSGLKPPSSLERMFYERMFYSKCTIECYIEFLQYLLR